MVGSRSRATGVALSTAWDRRNAGRAGARPYRHRLAAGGQADDLEGVTLYKFGEGKVGALYSVAIPFNQDDFLR